MKKITIVLACLFLLFSLNSFSQDRPHKKVQSARIEHSSSKRKPGKPVSKKITHKSGPKKHTGKSSGTKINQL